MKRKFFEVLTIINGKNQREVEDSNGEYPIYGSGGIIGYANKFLCPGNTVIIGRKGNINKPIYVDKPFWNVDTAFGLQADEKILLPKYLFYFCQRYNFEQHNKTVTIPSLTKADLLEIVIDVPEIDVQKRICKELDLIDSVICNRVVTLSTLDVLVKSRFIEMFGEPKSNPCNWKLSTIGEHCTVKGGKRVPKGMNFSSIPTKHPYLRVTDMKNATIIDDDIHYIDDEVYSKISRYVVAAGDVYLTNVGVNLGMAGVIPKKYDGANLTENAVKLIYSESELDGIYLSHYINSPGIQTYVNERKMTVGVPKLAIFRIESMPLLLPPIDLQRKYKFFVQKSDKSKLAVQQSIETLQTLKAKLMQDYFG